MAGASMRRELLIGAHMSIAGGMHRALEQGIRAGCRALQVFLKNSCQWQGKSLTEADRALFNEARNSSQIRSIVAHDSYLINLASADPNLFRKSIAALQEEMRRSNFLGIGALILHPGAHTGAGESAGLRRAAGGLNRALAEVPPPVMLLLENTAGQGTCIGHSFEHFSAILERVRHPDRVGFCLDTCHLFAAGYDIRTSDGYFRTMKEFDRLIGTERIFAFHVNDSRRPLGSRVDRHAHIGQGCIGTEAFRCLLNDRRFFGVPKILETPKGKDLAEDLMNLATLRSLADQGLAQE
jgi:deoxyribonuclease-4